MATVILDNIGSGNGLLPDGTKPLPEPMLTYHQRGSVAYFWEQELLKVSIQDMSLKKTFWKIFSNPPGANELRTLLIIPNFEYTVEPLYNTIVFHQNTHKRHPIARP